MAIVCPLCPQDACCHFKPLSPDPYIIKPADMTPAKFGHLNHLVDIICCISDVVATLQAGSVQSIVYCGTPLIEVSGVVTIPAIAVDGVTITGTGCIGDPLVAVNQGVCTDGTLTGDGTPGNCLSVVSSGGLAEFGYFFQTVGDVAGTIAANNGKALFQTASSNNTAGFAMVPASGDITVTNAGIYEIDWSLSAAEAGAMCVYINALKQDLAGSTYGSGAGTQQNTGKTLLTLAANDVISLRTDNCPAALTLQLAGTTNVNQVVASIMIKKVA